MEEVRLVSSFQAKFTSREPALVVPSDSCNQGCESGDRITVSSLTTRHTRLHMTHNHALRSDHCTHRQETDGRRQSPSGISSADFASSGSRIGEEAARSPGPWIRRSFLWAGFTQDCDAVSTDRCRVTQ